MCLVLVLLRPYWAVLVVTFPTKDDTVLFSYPGEVQVSLQCQYTFGLESNSFKRSPVELPDGQARFREISSHAVFSFRTPMRRHAGLCDTI